MDENTNNIPNDVNTQPETSTDGGSSPAEQTPATDAATTHETSTEPAQQAGDKTVPYDRFAEVNQNMRQTQQELAELKARIALQAEQPTQQQAQRQEAPEVMQAKEQLKGLLKELAPDLGFVSKDEIRQQEAVKAVGHEHDRLASKYNGADGMPKYDANAVHNFALEMGMTNAKGLEIAYKTMNEAQIMQARINKAMQQSRGVQSEVSNGTGSANTGVSNDDLMNAAKGGDSNATHLLLKRRLAGK